MVVAVLLGSVRSGRLAERVGKWVIAQLSARGHEAVLVDPLALELPMLDKMWKEMSAVPSAPLYPKLKLLADLYERADGFAVVTAEYNHSAPPALINLIDYFLEEYRYKPSAVISYSSGPFGGVRAAVSLRALLAEVGMSSIPSIQAVPNAASSLSEDGLALTQDLAEKSEKFFDEFDWYMRALRAERSK